MTSYRHYLVSEESMRIAVRLNRKGKGKGNVTRSHGQRIGQVPESYEYGTVTVLLRDEKHMCELNIIYS